MSGQNPNPAEGTTTTTTSTTDPAAAAQPAANGNSNTPPAEAPKAAAAAGTEPEKAPNTTQTPESKPVVPEKYDLKKPEGSLLNDEHVQSLTTFAKERGLSNEQAQAILERESQSVAAFQQSQLQQWNQIRDGWTESAKNDTEIGGDLYGESCELSKRVIDRFASPELKQAFVDTGYGNHPEMVRMLSRIGKLIVDDKLVRGGSQGPGQKSAAEVLYPSMQKQ